MGDVRRCWPIATFVRTRDRGVVGVDDDLGQERCDGPRVERVDELLLEEVADHAFALSAEHIEGIRCDVVRRVALKREKTDLRAVAMRDDNLMVAR